MWVKTKTGYCFTYQEILNLIIPFIWYYQRNSYCIYILDEEHELVQYILKEFDSTHQSSKYIYIWLSSGTDGSLPYEYTCKSIQDIYVK